MSCRGEAGPKARADLLVGGAGALGILGPMPAHWWTELGPRVSRSGACALVCGVGSWALW